MSNFYDIIVIGGGHAGCEAAYSSAKMGAKVLLLTMNMNQFAQMSCNPSIGGIGKGQLVREIDALGGLTGIVADKSMIQFRMLNRSKGPAMWSPRSQNDRYLFSYYWRYYLEQTENLSFFQDNATDIIVENNAIKGIKTSLNFTFYCKSLIVTAGTFLNGKIFIGNTIAEGGRIGDKSSYGLTESLNNYGIISKKFKTGTSARLDGRTIDFSKMVEQPGDENPGKFSFFNDTNYLTKQKSCYLTRTDEKVHDILRKGFISSPLFNKDIKGSGPRYCPSIEDKLIKFSDKNSHQLFLEPEGWDTIEYYINGFSSSLPENIQLEALRNINGLENVKIFRPGYAIEYDYFPPTQLKNTFESKILDNLYFAGQVNGTTGYEEAAAQGLYAGINAFNKINGKDPFILSRAEAYLGVLVDDLVYKGTDEPYRLFTSRAEYRILLRQDNADFRLTKKGYDLGLVDYEKLKLIEEKYNCIKSIINDFNTNSLMPDEINADLISNETDTITQKKKISDILLRPQMSINNLLKIDSVKSLLSKYETIINDIILEEAEIQIKYSGYIKKEEEIVNKLFKFENIRIKESFDYFLLNSLSYEAREKLNKIKPRTIGEASKISGVSPSDIAILLAYFGRI